MCVQIKLIWGCVQDKISLQHCMACSLIMHSHSRGITELLKPKTKFKRHAKLNSLLGANDFSSFTMQGEIMKIVDT